MGAQRFGTIRKTLYIKKRHKSLEEKGKERMKEWGTYALDRQHLLKKRLLSESYAHRHLPPETGNEGPRAAKKSLYILFLMVCLSSSEWMSTELVGFELE